MKLRDILETKEALVRSISPEATLQDAVDHLVEHRVGSLIVRRSDSCAREELLGIITERDILHACAAGKRPLAEVKVAEVMTAELIFGEPDEDVEIVMGLMTTRRIRHLPVLAEARLIGMISIGDVVKAQHDRMALENRLLKDYISG